MQYQYPAGSLSALGNEVLPTLQSLLRHGGLYGPHLLATSNTFFLEQVSHMPARHLCKGGLQLCCHACIQVQL